jgi:hypothetical protein
MTFDDSTMKRLAKLPALVPNPEQVDWVRARCHAAIARQLRRAERRASRRARIRLAMEPVLVAAFSAAYLLGLALDVASLR